MTRSSGTADVEALLMTAADDMLLVYEPLADAATPTCVSASSSSPFSSCSSSWDESIGFFGADDNDGEAALYPLTETFGGVDWAPDSGMATRSHCPIAAPLNNPDETSRTNAASGNATFKPDRKARRRAQAASSAGRYRHRKKARV